MFVIIQVSSRRYYIFTFTIEGGFKKLWVRIDFCYCMVAWTQCNKSTIFSNKLYSPLFASPLPWQAGHSPIVSSPCDSTFGSRVTGSLPDPLQDGQVTFAIWYNTSTISIAYKLVTVHIFNYWFLNAPVVAIYSIRASQNAGNQLPFTITLQDRIDLRLMLLL